MAGKYPESKVHEIYSQWHYDLTNLDDIYYDLTMTDVDRLWCETFKNDQYMKTPIVCATELKWSHKSDQLTTTQIQTYKWFEANGVPVYIVWINGTLTEFRVDRFGSPDEPFFFDAFGYADWLLSLRRRVRKYRKELEQSAMKFHMACNNLHCPWRS